MKTAAELVQDRVLLTAYALAAHNKLVVDDVIWCWNCSKRAALMPSLHCPDCLAESWRRLGIVQPECPNRLQTPEDVEACK